MGMVIARFIRRRMDGSEIVDSQGYDTLEEALQDMRMLSEVPGCRCISIQRGPIRMSGWELTNALKQYRGRGR